MEPDRQIVLIGTGSQFWFELAWNTAQALRDVSGELCQILLVTDQLITVAERRTAALVLGVRFVLVPPGDRWISRWLKTRLNLLCSGSHCLYLDADILPIGSITPIWELLEQGDLYLATSQAAPTVGESRHTSGHEKALTLQKVSPNYPQYNGGVIAWRNTPRTDRIFTAWGREWELFKQQDQLALVRALNSLGAIVGHLPQEFNWNLHYGINPDARLVHTFY